LIPRQMSQTEAQTRFDSLAAVASPQEILGEWRGHELFCGHPLEGLLTACRWWGKRFESAQCVYPQIYERRNGSTFCVDPARMPMSKTLSRQPQWLVRLLFAAAYPYVRSKKSAAHLEVQQFRGQQSVAMVYDRLPITDYLRRIDDNHLMGMMVMDKDRSGQNLFFVLERANPITK